MAAAAADDDEDGDADEVLEHERRGVSLDDDRSFSGLPPSLARDPHRRGVPTPHQPASQDPQGRRSARSPRTGSSLPRSRPGTRTGTACDRLLSAPPAAPRRAARSGSLPVGVQLRRDESRQATPRRSRPRRWSRRRPRRPGVRCGQRPSDTSRRRSFAADSEPVSSRRAPVLAAELGAPGRRERLLRSRPPRSARSVEAGEGPGGTVVGETHGEVLAAPGTSSTRSTTSSSSHTVGRRRSAPPARPCGPGRCPAGCDGRQSDGLAPEVRVARHGVQALARRGMPRRSAEPASRVGSTSLSTNSPRGERARPMRIVWSAPSFRRSRPPAAVLVEGRALHVQVESRPTSRRLGGIPPRATSGQQSTLVGPRRMGREERAAGSPKIRPVAGSSSVTHATWPPQDVQRRPSSGSWNRWASITQGNSDPRARGPSPRRTDPMVAGRLRRWAEHRSGMIETGEPESS